MAKLIKRSPEYFRIFGETGLPFKKFYLHTRVGSQSLPKVDFPKVHILGQYYSQHIYGPIPPSSILHELNSI